METAMKDRGDSTLRHASWLTRGRMLCLLCHAYFQSPTSLVRHRFPRPENKTGIGCKTALTLRTEGWTQKDTFWQVPT
jgi:hypothetical protein